MKSLPGLFALVLSLVAIVPATALAHSLRIGANHYLLQYPAERPGPLTVYIFASYGDEIPIDEVLGPERFAGITLLAPNGAKTAVETGAEGYHGGVVKIDHAGAYWLVSETKGAVSTRAKTRQLTYNYAKTLLQVSGPEADLTPSTKRLGQLLEIVPLENPSALAKGAALPLQVWFQGKPYSGEPTEVSAEHVAAAYIDNGVWTGSTDATGQVTMPSCAPGLWQLEVTIDLPADGALQSQTDKVRHRATLLFTVPGAKPIPRT